MKEYKNHTFVICAYKESEYLEECINSLKEQTVKSNIIMCTSTPNEHIRNMSNKYNIPLYINDGIKGIGPDWNFGVEKAQTDYVTIAHQDDKYEKNYLEEMMKKAEKYPDMIFAFTDYQEIREGKIVKTNLNLKIKRLMLVPLKFFSKSKFIKKMVLSVGNPIACPSVMLNTKIVGTRPYREDMKSNIDWGTWYDFVKYEGKFIYLSDKLTYHRVHSESETSKTIGSNKRIEEDYEMFCRFWPKTIAKFIMLFYKNAVKSNQ